MKPSAAGFPPPPSPPDLSPRAEGFCSPELWKGRDPFPQTSVTLRPMAYTSDYVKSARPVTYSPQNHVQYYANTTAPPESYHVGKPVTRIPSNFVYSPAYNCPTIYPAQWPSISPATQPLPARQASYMTTYAPSYTPSVPPEWQKIEPPQTAYPPTYAPDYPPSSMYYYYDKATGTPYMLVYPHSLHMGPYHLEEQKPRRPCWIPFCQAVAWCLGIMCYCVCNTVCGCMDLMIYGFDGNRSSKRGNRRDA